MKLTIHRGSKQIGGSCVEVSTASTRVILDVGLPLDDLMADRSKGKRNQPDDRETLLRQGVIPNVKGVFGDQPAVNAILLSHAHADHSGLLVHADPSIPIYLSKGTSKMLMAGSVFAGQPRLEKERGKEIKPGQPREIGDMRVTAYSVDHSAFDSLAFLIEADGKRLLYSGDLRLHGRKPGMAQHLIQAVSHAPVDILLMEGTHFAPDRKPGLTEVELEHEIAKQIADARGLVLAIFSPQHVDRLVTFYKAIKRNSRQFVIDPYTAFVMHLIAGRQCKIPNPFAASDIAVCFSERFLKSRQWRQIHSIHAGLIARRSPLETVLAAPGKYAMLFRPSMVDLLFNGELPRNARCIYSYWHGYLKNPEWIDLKSKLAKAGGDFDECHTSGHIFADDIVKFVQAVNPTWVTPIHTANPGHFHSRFGNVLALEDGQAHDLSVQSESPFQQ
mgnify:CR=1 FL=1